MDEFYKRIGYKIERKKVLSVWTINTSDQKEMNAEISPYK